MFKRDDFRTVIVIIIVCIVCLTIGFIIGFKKNTDKLTSVNEYNIFFSNVNYVNNYISMIAKENKGVINNLLDDRYIKENNIELLYNTYRYSDMSSFEANEMYYVQIRKNFIYYVKGNVYDINHDGKEIINENFSILIIHDTSTNSYSLYPVTDDNYSKIINSIWNIKINDNQYNKYIKTDDIGIDQICSLYLSDFLSNTFNGNYSSYDLLSENMKKIYTSKSYYQNYINNNFDIISSIADKCKSENIDDKRVYTVIDENENKYVFTENSIMNYKVDFYLKER